MKKLLRIFIAVFGALIFSLLFLKVVSNSNSDAVSILKYPYGAKSALVLSLDDLNAGYVSTSCEGKWVHELNLSKALENQKILMRFATKYQISFVLFTIPEYCPRDKTTNQCKKINLKENSVLIAEIKDNLNNQLLDLGLHSRYHYGQATPKPEEFGGGYETLSDWKYSINLLNELFNVDIDAWRSPGYRSPDYAHHGLNGLTSSTNFRQDLLELGIQQEWDFVDRGYYGVAPNNGTGFYEVYSYLCPFWKTRLSFICAIETKFKLKTRSWKIHWPFRKYILEKTTINEPTSSNVLEFTNFAYQKGRFQSQTKHWGCLGASSYLTYFEKLLPFLDKIGINKLGGIWVAPTAKDVRKWYEILNKEKYKVILNKEGDSLILNYKSLDNEGFNYFSFLIKDITNSSCPYLETSKNLTYGRNIVSLNQNQQILTATIEPKWRTLILKCSSKQNQMIATTLFVDEEIEPVKVNDSSIIFAKYSDYNGLAINNADAKLIIGENVYQMKNVHNRYEFALRASKSGYTPYIVKISKKGYEPQQRDMTLLVIKKDF